MAPRLLTLLLAGGLIIGGSAASAQPSRSGSGLVIHPKPADPNQMVRFSFKDADINDVLRFLAEVTGKTVYKDGAVSLRVTLRTEERIPASKAVKLVQTLLSLQGFALIERKDEIVVSTRSRALTLARAF
jgi:type II secretory pathway component GspD/PulD (secretin)